MSLWRWGVLYSVKHIASNTLLLRLWRCGQKGFCMSGIYKRIKTRFMTFVCSCRYIPSVPLANWKINTVTEKKAVRKNIREEKAKQEESRRHDPRIN